MSEFREIVFKFGLEEFREIRIRDAIPRSMPVPILWCKMESDDDIITPTIGNTGTIIGSPSYANMKFNNGGGLSNPGTNAKWPDGGNFNPDAWSAGIWFETKNDITDGVGFAGGKAFFTWGVDADNRITIYGDGGIKFRLEKAGAVTTGIIATTGITWLKDTSHHLGCIYNQAGINETSDTARIYLDNVLMGSISTAFPTMDVVGGNFHTSGYQIGASSFTGVIRVDNFKWYQETLFNFNGYNSEDGTF